MLELFEGKWTLLIDVEKFERFKKIKILLPREGTFQFICLLFHENLVLEELRKFFMDHSHWWSRKIHRILGLWLNQINNWRCLISYVYQLRGLLLCRSNRAPKWFYLIHRLNLDQLWLLWLFHLHNSIFKSGLRE